MMIPIDPSKSFGDLKNEVRKRFNVKATGFVVDTFHISLADEIGDVIESPKDEMVDVLCDGCDSEQDEQKEPAIDLNPKVQVAGGEDISKSVYENVCKKVETLTAELEKWRSGVLKPQNLGDIDLETRTPKNSTVRPSDSMLHTRDINEMLDDVESPRNTCDLLSVPNTNNYFQDNGSTYVEHPESERDFDLEVSEPDRKSQQELKTEAQEIIAQHRSSGEEEFGETELALGVLTGKISTEDESKLEDEIDLVENKPKPKPKVEDNDHWEQIQRNIEARRRLKAQKEREEREKLRREFEPTSNEPITMNEEQKNARKEAMLQKMSERLANRKGPRLKLEPTKKPKIEKRRKSEPTKKPKIEKRRKSTTKIKEPLADEENKENRSDTLSLGTPIEDGSEERAFSKKPSLSPRSQVAAKMADRMKDRKGPRLSLEPTRKVKEKSVEAVSKPKVKKPSPKKVVPRSSSGNLFIDGDMNQKEAKRIERLKLEIGDKLEITGHREGVLKFIGETDFSKGVIFGLELCDGSLGDNSGIVDEKRYFECKENRGVFLPSTGIRKKCRKPKKKEPVRNIYRRRIIRIFEEFNPSKVKKIDNLLDKYSGNEHQLYVNVCKKYYVSPEKEYKDS